MPNKTENTVIGFDPGLTRCGFGIVSKGNSRQVSFLEVGVFESEKELEQSLRIALIGDKIGELLDRVRPEQIAIERLFAQQTKQQYIEPK